MAEDWDVYRCTVDDAPASIYLDLGIAGKAPQSKRPHLLRISFRLLTPNAEGLSDSGEAETLFEIEDVLFAAISKRLRARYVGRITTQGRRDHFYYGANAAGFDEAVREIQSQFTGYEFTPTEQSDPDWETYFELLSPSDLDLQTIHTRRQVESLIRQGEDVSQPRDIDHWLYFPSEIARQRFIEQISGQGFVWREFAEADPVAEYAYGLVLVRRDQVELISLDGLVTDLFLRAQNFGGVYTGWGQGLQDGELE